MATIKTTVAANWNIASDAAANNTVQPQIGFWAKYLTFVDGQRDNRTLWFFISLSIHATIFLPLPILLIGYLNAPIAILGVTMFFFFANFVANMGGSGIRTTLGLFIASTIVHLAMVIITLAL